MILNYTLLFDLKENSNILYSFFPPIFILPNILSSHPHLKTHLKHRGSL